MAAIHRRAIDFSSAILIVLKRMEALHTATHMQCFAFFILHENNVILYYIINRQRLR